MRRTACLLLLAACGPVSPSGAQPAHVSTVAASALAATQPLLDDARRAFNERRWDDAIAVYDKFLMDLPDRPSLGGWRDFALYNEACAYARSGRAAKAAEVFAESVAHGFRPRVVQVGDAWFDSPGVSLEYAIADADLDAIRKEPAYRRSLDPYLAGGAPAIELVGPAGAPAPAVVVLAAEDEEAAQAMASWRAAAQGRSVLLACVEGPVRPRQGMRRWTLGDTDERWAVAKLRAVVEALEGDPRVERGRILLAGLGPRPGEAAWASALALGPRVAGLAALEARFERAWRADAVAQAPESWRVVVAPADWDAARMLRQRGIEARRVGRSNDVPKTAAAVLDALLQR